jgi:LmbE family N-acetylglucosaminyl deacetylase
MPEKPYEHIYLSPHLDDAALSCGGRIHQERQIGLPVLVVNVMAGDAPVEANSMPTPILADLHTRWELETDPNPVAARRSEDQDAMTVLNADALNWEWPECVYRRSPHTGEFLYPSEESLWGTLHSAEHGLPAQLARQMEGLPLAPGGRVYVPLTVGDHVDHHIVRQAAEIWGVPYGEIIYYEEYPYAEHPEALSAVLGDGRGWQAETVWLDEKDLGAKARAVACYQSQISTFYSGVDEIALRLRDYATVAGEGRGWAERYWRHACGKIKTRLA